MNDELIRVRESFERQQAMRLIGAELISVKSGEVELAMPFRAEVSQQQGFVHAGVLTALLDSACGYAALTTMAGDRDVVSVEFKMNLLSPAVGERFRAIGKVRRTGKTLVVCTGEAFAQRGSEEKLICLMQATMYAVESSSR